MKTGFLLLFVCLATCLLVESKKYGGHQGKHNKHGKKNLVDKHNNQKQYKEQTPKVERVEKKYENSVDGKEKENSDLNDRTVESRGSKKDQFQKSKYGKYENLVDVQEKRNSNSNDVPIETSESKKEKFIQEKENSYLNDRTIESRGSKKGKFQKSKSGKYENRVDVQEKQNSNANDASIEISGSKKEQFRKGFKSDKFAKESKNTKVHSTEGADFKNTNDKNKKIRQKETRKPQKEEVEKIPEPVTAERKKRDTEQVSQVQDRTVRENKVPQEKGQQINEIEAGCLKRDNIYAPRPEQLQNETSVYKGSGCCTCQGSALETTYEDVDFTLNNISGSCLVESNSAVVGVN